MSQVKEQLEAVKRLKDAIVAMELDVRFLAAKANIAKAQFEEMEATIKAFEIRDKYVETMNILNEERAASAPKDEVVVEDVKETSLVEAV